MSFSVIGGVLAGLILFAGAGAGEAAQRKVVGEPVPLPLGTLRVDEAAGYIHFSLGNGRALRLAVRDRASSRGAALRLVAGSPAGAAPVLNGRRNIRWRK